MATITTGTESGFNWGKAISAGLVGVVAAAVLAGIYGLITNAIWGAPAPPPPNPDAPAIIVTAGFYAGAAAAFTLIGAVVFVLTLRFSGENGMRNFLIIAGVALLLSFVTVTQPGIETGDRIALAMAHIVAAVGAVPGMVLTYRR